MSFSSSDLNIFSKTIENIDPSKPQQSFLRSGNLFPTATNKSPLHLITAPGSTLSSFTDSGSFFNSTAAGRAGSEQKVFGSFGTRMTYKPEDLATTGATTLQLQSSINFFPPASTASTSLFGGFVEKSFEAKTKNDAFPNTSMFKGVNDVTDQNTFGGFASLGSSSAFTKNSVVSQQHVFGSLNKSTKSSMADPSPKKCPSIFGGFAAVVTALTTTTHNQPIFGSFNKEVTSVTTHNPPIFGSFNKEATSTITHNQTIFGDFGSKQLEDNSSRATTNPSFCVSNFWQGAHLNAKSTTQAGSSNKCQTNSSQTTLSASAFEPKKSITTSISISDQKVFGGVDGSNVFGAGIPFSTRSSTNLNDVSKNFTGHNFNATAASSSDISNKNFNNDKNYDDYINDEEDKMNEKVGNADANEQLFFHSEKVSQVNKSRRIKLNQRNMNNASSTSLTKPSKKNSSPKSSSACSYLQCTSLIVRDVPLQCNNVAFLKKHFSAYGTVTKAQANVKNNSAVVHFDCHESARNAKVHAHWLTPTVGVKLFWKALASKTGNHGNNSNNNNIGNISDGSCLNDDFSNDARFNNSNNNNNNNNKNYESNNYNFVGDNDDVKGDGTNKTLDSAAEEDEGQNGFHSKVNPNIFTDDADNNVKGDDDLDNDDRPEAVKDDDDDDLIRNQQNEMLTSTTSSSSSSLGTSLQALLTVKATTAAERFKILDQRDKILKSIYSFLKLHRTNTTDPTSAMRNVGEDGLCLDMCPEKERYLRENQRRLSPFEVLSSGNKTALVDHNRAVKEYIRSSADQDMPPPEELRPANVLEMTMDYLLSDVINKGGPGMWGEWYNFLWNRMRAIRKDIVQQRLCNERAVQLTEKSTRFHILCSATLCEEDPSVFDQKINSENLTKCLQSLKELYHDLSLKGIHCCHEAEFRGYMILMNLNNADVLSEAQHWPEHILRSEFVVRSIAVHTAVTSNNYVKFFRIVRQSSFLTSCILHRYFNQMRMVAVKRVAKAFYPSASPGIIMYSWKGMMEQLGYDNMNDFNELLAHFNLYPQMSNINEDSRSTSAFDCIIINGRSNRIVESDQVLPARKSFTLVECKITSSLGEIVNGGAMGSVIRPQPQISFNEEGFYMMDDNTKSLLHQYQLLQDELQQQQQHQLHQQQLHQQQLHQQQLHQQQLQQLHQQQLHQHQLHQQQLHQQQLQQLDVQQIAQESTEQLFIEVLYERVHEIHEELCLEQQQQQREEVQLFVRSFVEDLYNTVLADVSRETVLESLHESRQMMMMMMKKREEMMREMMMEREEMVREMMMDVMSDVLYESMCDVVSDLNRDLEISKQAAHLVTVELINDVITEEVENKCREFHESHVSNKLRRLDELKERVRKKKLLDCFNVWMEELRIKKTNDTYPCLPNIQQHFQQTLDNFFPCPIDRPTTFSTDQQQIILNDVIQDNVLKLNKNISISLLPVGEIRCQHDLLRSKLQRERIERDGIQKFCDAPLDMKKMMKHCCCEKNDGDCGGRSNSDIYIKLVIHTPNSDVHSHARKKMSKMNYNGRNNDHTPLNAFNAEAPVLMKWLKKKFENSSAESSMLSSSSASPFQSASSRDNNDNGVDDDVDDVDAGGVHTVLYRERFPASQFERSEARVDVGDVSSGSIRSGANTSANNIDDDILPTLSSVNLCVKVLVDDDDDDDHHHHLLGTTGIIFVLSSSRSDDGDGASLNEEVLNSDSLRLHKLLSSIPKFPPIPIIIVRPEDPDFSNEVLSRKLGIMELQNAGLVSCFDYQTVGMGVNICNPRSSILLEDSVHWLLRRTPEKLDIVTNSFVEYFEEGIFKHFASNVMKHLRSPDDDDDGGGGGDDDCHTSIASSDVSYKDLTKFYNDVIVWMTTRVTDQHLTNFNYPVVEFSSAPSSGLPPSSNWNSKERLSQINDLSMQLLLPEFNHSDNDDGEYLEDGDDGGGNVWRDDDGGLWSYVAGLVEATRRPSNLLYKVQQIVLKAKKGIDGYLKMMKLYRSLSSKFMRCMVEMRNMMKLEVVMSCLQFKLYQVSSFIEEMHPSEPLTVSYCPALHAPFNNHELLRKLSDKASKQSSIPNKLMSPLSSPPDRLKRQDVNLNSLLNTDKNYANNDNNVIDISIRFNGNKINRRSENRKLCRSLNYESSHQSFSVNLTTSSTTTTTNNNNNSNNNNNENYINENVDNKKRPRSDDDLISCVQQAITDEKDNSSSYENYLRDLLHRRHRLIKTHGRHQKNNDEDWQTFVDEREHGRLRGRSNLKRDRRNSFEISGSSLKKHTNIKRICAKVDGDVECAAVGARLNDDDLSHKLVGLKFDLNKEKLANELFENNLRKSLG